LKVLSQCEKKLHYSLSNQKVHKLNLQLETIKKLKLQYRPNRIYECSFDENHVDVKDAEEIHMKV